MPENVFCPIDRGVQSSVPLIEEKSLASSADKVLN